MSPFLKIKTNILCQKTLKAIIFAFDLKIIRLYQLITQSEHLALIQIRIQKAGQLKAQTIRIRGRILIHKMKVRIYKKDGLLTHLTLTNQVRIHINSLE